MSKAVWGLIFLPAGIVSMCLAAVWQMYVVLTESYPLNRFQGRRLAGVAAAMFFSFSLAVYIFCPNARRKGVFFAVLAGGGALMYLLAKWWLPWQA
ncbi:hypothetical protein V6667_03665 [Neisseria leonii]|uniref:Uncharacterized protein n=1 Tax=Neisseria leonii TaxID=2995413 RepID=A0A9X4E1I4_9NEIS|nr:hypothetical protein [Neisseria sp. 51.81]MDD9327049.1 hypothetical protein [Neisseria sp. 51.81]